MEIRKGHCHLEPCPLSCRKSLEFEGKWDFDGHLLRLLIDGKIESPVNFHGKLSF